MNHPGDNFVDKHRSGPETDVQANDRFRAIAAIRLAAPD